jgi:hypothetical protein
MEWGTSRLPAPNHDGSALAKKGTAPSPLGKLNPSSTSLYLCLHERARVAAVWYSHRVSEGLFSI